MSPIHGKFTIYVSPILCQFKKEITSSLVKKKKKKTEEKKIISINKMLCTSTRREINCDGRNFIVLNKKGNKLQWKQLVNLHTNDHWTSYSFWKTPQDATCASYRPIWSFPLWLHDDWKVPEGVMILRSAKDEWDVTTGLIWNSQDHDWSTFSGMTSFLLCVTVFLLWYVLKLLCI